MKNLVFFIFFLLIFNSVVLIMNVVKSALLNSCEINLGWPFIFYQRFQVSGSPYPNYGWSPANFFYNELIYSAASIILLLFIFRFYEVRIKRKNLFSIGDI